MERYSRSTDFPNGLDESQLDNEIRTNSNITTTLLGISTDGDNVDIIFQSTISALEKTELETMIIPNHIPKTPKEPITLEIDPSSDIITAQLLNGIGYFPALYSQTVIISKEGKSGQYTTIKEALDANTNLNTIFIVHPGTYIENNPLIIPPNSVIKCSGTTSQSTIVAANSSSDLIVLNPWCQIQGFILTGSSGVGARGIYYDGSLSGSTVYALVKECIISDCDIGIETSNGPDTLLGYRTLVTASGSGVSPSKGIYVHSGGQFNASSISVAGALTPYTPIMDGVICEDVGSKLSLTTSNVHVCTRAVTQNNDGEVELNLLTARGNVTGLYVGATGTNCKLRANSFTMIDSVSKDIDIQAVDADIGIFSSEIDDGKVNNPNNIRISNRSHIKKYNKIYEIHSGDLRFGGKGQKTVISLGEGKYDDNQMIVLSNSNLEVGTWVDNTIAAKDYNIPGFDIFQGTSPGNCCYFGRDTTLIGCKLNITTATSSTTTRDDVIWEYWDGSAWSQFQVMVTEAESPYYYKTDSVVSQTGKYNVRFGLKSTTPFADKSLNGNTLKWVRMRIVNAISDIPYTQYSKLHVNQTKINSTGFLENFGDSRPIKRLPWTINDTEPANASPDNQDIYISDKLGVGRKENRFKNGVVDRLGMNIFLPMDLDVGFPIKIKFAILGDSGTPGDVEFVARWNTTNNGSTVYRTTAAAPTTSTGEKTITTIINISSSNIEHRGELVLDLNRVNPYPSTGTAQLLTVSIERNATGGNANDTYAGNVSFIQITPFYISWRLGGFIDAF